MNRRVSFSKLTRFGALCSVLCGFSACNGCGSEKPYTPFGVASTLPSTNSAAPPAVPDPGAVPPVPSVPGGFAPRKAELVPGAPRAWQGANLSLISVEERGFAQVLPADFDGDQKTDAIAWLVPDATAKNAPPGELWYFANGAPGRKLAALPGFVPNSPDCPLTVTLTQTGPRSATLDASATCQTPMIARSATRALVVVSPSVERPVLLTLRSAAAAPNETLNLLVDSSDQDQDGRDDVRVTVSAGVLGSSEPASADLAWLDRAAGASREGGEPAASLTRMAQRLVARARSKHGDRGAERVSNAIRLISSICAEGGVARVFDEEGTPFRCGDLGHVMDSLLASEIESALAQGDVLEAFADLGRDGWYFAKLSSAQRKTLERDLLHAVVRSDAGDAFVARAQPLVPRLPHYSPLWFEADGALLIRTDGGVTRVSADRTSEAALAADAGTPSWPLELSAENGARVTGTSHACDRSELLINASDAAHTMLPPLVSSLLAARPASCAGHGTGPSVAIRPLSFDGQTLVALLAGSHSSTSDGKQKAPEGLPALGTPRSPDGRVLVSATELGLLLTGERKELWQTSALQAHANAAKFTDCVVANDARAVACIDGNRAIIFEHPKQPAASEHAKEPSTSAGRK